MLLVRHRCENTAKVAPHSNKNISSDGFHRNMATTEKSNTKIEQELNKIKTFINITCFHIGILNISPYSH